MKVDDTREIHDGEFVIVRITEDLYDQAIELYQKYFMKYENICIATSLLGSQEAIDEMEILIRAILRDGVSFAVKHVNTNQLVAMCINKILNPSAGCTLDTVMDSFRSPPMQSVSVFLGRMETTYDLFKEWNVDCVMEIVILSTRTDFGQKGLGLILSKLAFDVAANMMHGTLHDREYLPDHVKNMKPQAVCSVFTSKYSQRVGEKLGFETLLKIPFKDFEFNGKNFAEKIDAIHEFSTFAALRVS